MSYIQAVNGSAGSFPYESITITFSNPVTTGDTIIVVTQVPQGYSASVSDSQGNHYTNRGGQLTGNGVETQYWDSILVSGSSSFSVTVTQPLSGGGVNAQAWDYDDISAFDTNSSFGAFNTNVHITTSFYGETLIGAACLSSGGASWAGIQALWTPSSGWTARQNGTAGIDATIGEVAVTTALTATFGLGTGAYPLLLGYLSKSVARPTGVSASFAVNSPTISAGSVVHPAGVTFTSAQGTPTISAGAKVSPSGVTAATAVGMPTASGTANVTVSPAGVSASFAVGTPTISAGATVSPSGVTFASAVGTPVAFTTIILPPSGMQWGRGF